MRTVQWGLSIAVGGELAEPAVVAEIAAAAEAAGWDGVFVWDHLWHRDGTPFADPFVTLAAIAVATAEVALGPLVTPLPRRRPHVVAQQASTLDRLSGGRLVLGLGLGSDNYGEYSAVGDPDGQDDRARAGRLDAGIEFLLPALAGDLVPSAGRVTTVAARRRPRCPIWVAGRSARRAGPQRIRRHGLEGLALVGGGRWRAADVEASCALVDDDVEIALVGGEHDDPVALAAAGATWLIPELLPGTTAAEAHAFAADGPGLERPPSGQTCRGPGVGASISRNERRQLT